MVKPNCAADPGVITEKFGSIGNYLTVPLLNKLRTYITSCRLADYSLSDETQRAVQDDFVTSRQQQQGEGASNASMTVEDLHQHLVLARLVALSFGKSSLDPSDWEKVKNMEAERKQRVRNLPSRSGANANGIAANLRIPAQ